MDNQYPSNGQPSSPYSQYPQQPQYPPSQYPQYPQYPQQDPLEPRGQRSYQTVPLAAGQGYPPQVPQYQQQPQQPQKKRINPWLPGGGIGCLLQVLCVCTAALAVSLNPNTWNSAALDNSTDTPYVAPPVPTSPPTATLSTAAAVAAYLKVVHTQSATLSADFDAVSTSCGTMVTAEPRPPRGLPMAHGG